ncbi:MAG: c-type cytochrome, partial [Candidatus Eiseniibacteriota bacterium]
MRTAGLWLLRIVVALALLIVAGFAALGLVVRGQLSRKFTVADVALNIPSDSAAIARGQHLNVIFNCRGCHGADLEGTVMFEAPPVGRLCAPNLTRTGVTRSFTPSDWNRAVRHGVKPDGTGLMIMPAELFHGLSDADLGAIVAYAQSLPPVDKVVPPSRLRPVGWLMAMMLPDG